LKRTALLIVVITILSKFVGFGREMVLAYFYGASSVSDAYLISMTIPRYYFCFYLGCYRERFHTDVYPGRDRAWGKGSR